jgi:hypothetical protein
MSETTIQVTADSAERPAGACCGTSPRVDSAVAAPEATSPCCGTAAEAQASGGCCGAGAKADAIASGAGCCG